MVPAASRRPIRLPRVLAYGLSLLGVPLAMEAMYFAAYAVNPHLGPYGPSTAYVWCSILMPGLVLNALLAVASLRERSLARFLPRLITLLVFSALGMVLYFFLTFADPRGVQAGV